MTERWALVSTEAVRPRFRSVSVSSEAHAVQISGTDDPPEISARKLREGRFGAAFGTAVHTAIGLKLRNAKLTVREAVRLAAVRANLEHHLDEAAADVFRALKALDAAGLVMLPGRNLQLEYPVASAWEGGQLISGYIDLIGVTMDSVDIVDFKTDAPPTNAMEHTYPHYLAQIRTYKTILLSSGIFASQIVRSGLLFTADGSIHWMENG